MKIITYKMTHATGFAPNHDCGILTLATCKPGVREKAEVGDWIAGFTSTAKNAGKTPRGQETENEKVAEFIDFVMNQEPQSDIDYSAVSRKNSSSCSKN